MSGVFNKEFSERTSTNYLEVTAKEKDVVRREEGSGQREARVNGRALHVTCEQMTTT